MNLRPPKMIIASLIVVLSGARCGTEANPAPADARGELHFPDMLTGDGNSRTDLARPGDQARLDTLADVAKPDARADQAGPHDLLPGDAVCSDGAFQCGTPTMVQQCVGGRWQFATVCQAGQACIEGACQLDAGCQPGDVFGCTNVHTRRVCHPNGHVWVDEPCPGESLCYGGECQDLLCVPNDIRCQDIMTVERCNADSTAWEVFQQCQEGAVCKDGACVSGCEDSIKLFSYIGCEYWTVDLDNYHDPSTNPKPDEVPHAVVISNPNQVPATIRFVLPSGQDLPLPEPDVPPHSAVAFTMPRNDVDGTGIFTDKSIRILSNWPVVAVQFNPFNNAHVYSNDASLLLPVNVLGREYWVLTWGGSPDMDRFGFKGQHSYFTAIAVQPGTTQVTVTAGGKTDPGPGVDLMERGETRTFALEQFGVLSIQGTSDMILDAAALDMTGTHVVSDKPIVVFSGHEEAVVGTSTCEDDCCAEHMEEQNLPVNTWDTKVVCVKGKPRGSSTEMDVWRVMAAYDGTTITTDPPIADLDGATINAGQYVQIETSESFEITASAPIQVAQYFIGQHCTENFVGDPDLIFNVPSAQYRDSYYLLTPEGYQGNFATLIRPPGVVIELDEAPVDATFQTIGSGSWEFAYVDLQPGLHRLTAMWPFGVIAYGRDSAVSYGYPGGLDLKASSWAPH